ncbi:hypothetical protein GCM10008111_09700 [Alishewanella tabrizica]|uniref:PEP-CTERM protein-sorting domain-containing protein n=2 Tax=Alishewanella tabrizica TaxID=671278 RepID=A0ABQ2WKL3_9ALTE|nr:hypothetical protein GCM10008111_09700 [Alishewanella tabrizica]
MVDNHNGVDFILLEFPSPIQLTSITNTWQWYNTNLSVAAFKNTFSTSNLNTLTLKELAESAIFKASYLNTGAHYSFASNNSLTPSDITQVSSQYWLIGAYNAVFNSANCSKNCPTTVNGLKFGSITTTKTTTTPTPTPVPTPGTLSLFAVVLLGLSLHKRRKAK